MGTFYNRAGIVIDSDVTYLIEVAVALVRSGQDLEVY